MENFDHSRVLDKVIDVLLRFSLLLRLGVFHVRIGGDDVSGHHLLEKMG
jgi:hypothetical protein